ncbi:hypothetical protein ACTFIY_002470 [Dictyostelium cf. discoideum]
MKSIISIILISLISNSIFNVGVFANGQACLDDNNPCTVAYNFYGSCFNVLDQWVDCKSTNEYKQCVSNCKKSPSYSACASVSCNFETFACEYGRHWNGCDDLNKCTIDSCNSTSGCIHTSVNCNDNNNSTIDNCLQTFGCSYTVNPAINGVTSCSTNANCNDNRACTTDVCSNGKCQYTLNCASSYACSSNGQCYIVPQPTN